VPSGEDPTALMIVVSIQKVMFRRARPLAYDISTSRAYFAHEALLAWHA